MSDSAREKDLPENPGVSPSQPAEADGTAPVGPTSPVKLEEATNEDEASEAEPTVAGKKPRKKKDKKKKGSQKCLGSARGIETMFRASYQTDTDLIGIADGKANIMISINGLIISIILAAMGPRLIESTWLVIPTAALLLTCLVSIVYAVLCARPRVLSSSVTLDDVRTDRANILFFGNFVNMPLADYQVGMTELMLDTDRLYHNMIRDLYGLGLVLQKKFRLLRIAYTVFMIGLVISVLLFAAAFTYESTVTL